MAKVFKLAADQMKELIADHRACIASDRITVDGALVGYMYREEPDEQWDSGWRFMAGDESDYVDEPKNFEIYALNTIANYDPGIIPLLTSTINVAFERNPRTKVFEQVPFE